MAREIFKSGLDLVPLSWLFVFGLMNQKLIWEFLCRKIGIWLLPTLQSTKLDERGRGRGRGGVCVCEHIYTSWVQNVSL